MSFYRFRTKRTKPAKAVTATFHVSRSPFPPSDTPGTEGRNTSGVLGFTAYFGSGGRPEKEPGDISREIYQ